MVNEMEELKTIKDAEENSRITISQEESRSKESIEKAKKDSERDISSLKEHVIKEKSEKIDALKRKMEILRKSEIEQTVKECNAMKYTGTEEKLYKEMIKKISQFIRD
ncbi:MAG: hypothetical protein ACYDAO_06515 [Thermoplasmataceae archaeon]